MLLPENARHKTKNDVINTLYKLKDEKKIYYIVTRLYGFFFGICIWYGNTKYARTIIRKTLILMAYPVFAVFGNMWGSQPTLLQWFGCCSNLFNYGYLICRQSYVSAVITKCFQFMSNLDATTEFWLPWSKCFCVILEKLAPLRIWCLTQNFSKISDFLGFSLLDYIN